MEKFDGLSASQNRIEFTELISQLKVIREEISALDSMEESEEKNNLKSELRQKRMYLLDKLVQLTSKY